MSQGDCQTQYIIRGGVEGRERLRLLARVMRPSTLGLLKTVDVRAGMTCLDVGCGGGDVTFELARMVGPNGRVVGIDIDEKKLELAREEADALQLDNVTFRQSEVMTCELEPEFDVVYSRFLLTHLADSAGALSMMHRALSPGGILVIEDIDFAGHFCEPPSAAFARYLELFTTAVKLRGADPNIGPRLPAMLKNLACQQVQMNVVQPAAIDGETKLVNPITMENIADAVLTSGLATLLEVEQIIAELYDYARNPQTVMSIVRVVQAWGYRSVHVDVDESMRVVRT